MRAISSARRSRAARRAAASIRSQGIGASRAAGGSSGGSGGSRNASFNCTGALLLRHRPDGSAAESVEEVAQPKQITKTAQDAQAGAVIEARAGGDVPLALVPVGPLGRDQRATAVGQAGERKEDAVAVNTANNRQRTTLKRMALADDRHRIRDIAAMGSLSPFPSGAFRMPTC